ncbi:colorectal mutant cancer protein [Biomphalaria glabrata]|nr:colorectal mutant cancer protein-like [Biomphalaria glabrata]
MPKVRKCLLDTEVTKRSDPTRLLHAAKETIASYPAGVSTICMDGSVVRLSGNPKSVELSGPCHEESSLKA